MVQMEAEQVIQKILGDARAEAAKIGEQAAERQAAENARTEEQAAQFKKETEAMAVKAAADEMSQRLAVARMEAAKEYLTGKAAIVDEVFAEARRTIEKLPDGEYRDLMTRLMLASVESGDEQVIAGKDDPRIDQKLVDGVNATLKDQGKGNLTLSKDKHNLGGGFLLQHGKVRTNVTLDVLVQQARKDLEIELARDLFAKDADASRPQ